MAKLIAFEGIDGSGKGTQSRLLVEHLQAAGVRVRLLGFPRYSETFFGARVGDFLNGKFGKLWDLPPFLIALLFAGDRLESRELLQQSLADHDVVVLDRYVSSNVAHQSARCSPQEQRQVQDWIEHVEYGIHALPTPDLNILLDVPVQQAQELVLRKQARDYTDRAADLQEADGPYLQRVRETYLALTQRQPGWSVIPLLDATRLRTVEEIAALVTAIVGDLLNTAPTHQP